MTQTKAENRSKTIVKTKNFQEIGRGESLFSQANSKLQTM